MINYSQQTVWFESGNLNCYSYEFYQVSRDDNLIKVEIPDEQAVRAVQTKINNVTSLDRLDDKEREYFERSNEISQCLGIEGTIKPNIYTIIISEGDRLLISSDGIHDNLIDAEIYVILRDGSNSKIVVEKLLDQAQFVSRNNLLRSKPDDMSAIVIDFPRKVEREDTLGQWEKMEAEVNEIQDALGKGVEDGIKESIIVMNLLGFKTSGYCEGHLESSERAPWIDFTVEDSTENRKKSEEAFDEAEKAQQEGASEDVLDNLYQTAHRLSDEAQRPLLEKIQELAQYLDIFYEKRQSTFEARLTLRKNTFSCRLINQGAMLQKIQVPKTRGERLALYQNEMREFTDFLKSIFFNAEKNSGTK